MAALCLLSPLASVPGGLAQVMALACLTERGQPAGWADLRAAAGVRGELCAAEIPSLPLLLHGTVLSLWATLNLPKTALNFVVVWICCLCWELQLVTCQTSARSYFHVPTRSPKTLGVYTGQAWQLSVRVQPPWLAKPNFKLMQFNSQETDFKRGLIRCFQWEELGGLSRLWMPPTGSVSGWQGCGRAAACPPGHCVQDCAEPCWDIPKPSSPLPALLCSRRGGSTPAASSPSAWPQGALEVQLSINSLNPSNFPQCRSAGSRPVFCGLHWPFINIPRCLHLDDYIPKTCLWCFDVPTNSIWKASHWGPRSSLMALVELLQILELLLPWVPAARHSRLFGSREPWAGSEWACQHTFVPAVHLARRAPLEVLLEQESANAENANRSMLRQELRSLQNNQSWKEVRSISLYSHGEVPHGFQSFLKCHVIAPVQVRCWASLLPLSP